MADAYKAWIGSGFFECPVCGGQFYMPPYITEWRYKVKLKGKMTPVCSYTCFRRVEKKESLRGEHYMKSYLKR